MGSDTRRVGFCADVTREVEAYVIPSGRTHIQDAHIAGSFAGGVLFSSAPEGGALKTTHLLLAGLVEGMSSSLLFKQYYKMLNYLRGKKSMLLENTNRVRGIWHTASRMICIRRLVIRFYWRPRYW